MFLFGRGSKLKWSQVKRFVRSDHKAVIYMERITQEFSSVSTEQLLANCEDFGLKPDEGSAQSMREKRHNARARARAGAAHLKAASACGGSRQHTHVR